MGELYDAASGRSEPQPPTPPSRRGSSSRSRRQPRVRAAAAASSPSSTARSERHRSRWRRRCRRGAEPTAAAGGDLDGARLIALNMALNGESRADTERYLAENFQLPDRLKLIDEVYAAIEG